jgi:hypothetical protein
MTFSFQFHYLIYLSKKGVIFFGKLHVCRMGYLDIEILV